MKAQRRHELQENALAKVLADLPLYLRFHFGKVILGLLLIVLVVMLIRHRTSSGLTRGQEAVNSLTEAKRLINQIPLVALGDPDPAKVVSERRRAASQAEGLIEIALTQTEDPADAPLRAEAHVARGDLYWTLANLPRPAASTQPATQPATQPLPQMPQTPEEYLSRAQEAYETVVNSYSDRPLAVATARFGLAAIAENRRQWDVARAQYEAIARIPKVSSVVASLANERIEYLARFQEPLYTGNIAAPPTTMPESTSAPTTATQPAATQPVQ